MARVAMEIDSVRHCQFNEEWAVILKNKLLGLYLPIYVGEVQAEIIKGELLQDFRYPLPENYDLSSIGLDATKNDLISITIDRFENNIFYAKLLFSHDDRFHEIDFPPARAIALGLRQGAPIFVLDEILYKAAIRVNEINCI